MVKDSGSPRADAESDFLRARRHQTLSALAGWLRADATSAKESLSFTETVEALGRRGERRRGVQVIPLDQVVGSVDKVRDFDRRFRPTSDRSRQRWEQIMRKTREGHSFPPIEVYQLGNLYFVRDGHHRVSVARAMGTRLIEADVTEIETVIDTEGIGGRRDLDAKSWGLRFLRRVPLTGHRRAEIVCTDPTDYHRLAEMVEAWACRLMHREETYLDAATMARRWFDEEYSHVLGLIDQAGVRGPEETGADAYIRVSGERYRLLREHDWSSEVLEVIRGQQDRRRRASPGGAVRA